jgi:hypothetical protein
MLEFLKFSNIFSKFEKKLASKVYGPIMAIFRKMKGLVFAPNCRSQKTKRIGQRT